MDSIRHILREVTVLLLLNNWRLHDLYDTLQADPQRACYTSTTPRPDLLRKYWFRRDASDKSGVGVGVITWREGVLVVHAVDRPTTRPIPTEF